MPFAPVMGVYANCVLPLGSLSPTDPLNGAGALTSALIIFRAVEERGRKLEFYRGLMANMFARSLALSLRLRGLAAAGGVSVGIRNFSAKLLHSLCK